MDNPTPAPAPEEKKPDEAKKLNPKLAAAMGLMGAMAIDPDMPLLTNPVGKQSRAAAGRRAPRRVPTYRMMHAYKKPTPVSLLDRIVVAKTATEVDALLEEGAKYEHAADATRRRWARVAKDKKLQLEADAKADAIDKKTK